MPQVYGAGRFPTQLGACCDPQPGDAIAGCLVEGNQVVVHRTDCAVVLQYQQTGHDNLIEVHWSEGRRVCILVELFILAYDRAGLLRDITTILADEQIEVMEVNTRTDRSAGTARMNLQVEVGSFHALSRVLEKISHLNNVIEARRVDADLSK